VLKQTRPIEAEGKIMANTNGEKPLTVVQKLRNMLADPEKLIVCPGVYDGFTARIALQEGAECLYMVSMLVSPIESC